jgi:hypothetical protein
MVLVDTAEDVGRDHTESLVSENLSPTASFAAVARVVASALESLATLLLVSLEAALVASLALSPTKLAAFLEDAISTLTVR